MSYREQTESVQSVWYKFLKESENALSSQNNKILLFFWKKAKTKTESWTDAQIWELQRYRFVPSR